MEDDSSADSFAIKNRPIPSLDQDQDEGQDEGQAQTGQHQTGLDQTGLDQTGLDQTGLDYDDSSSSGSECRPQYLRDSSGSDSDYHRYMKNNFITEVYHAKDYDYSTNDDEDDNSHISSHFSRNTSRSSSFTSAVGEFIDITRDHQQHGSDTGMGIMVAAGKFHADSSSEDGSSEGHTRRGSPRRALRLSQQQVQKIGRGNPTAGDIDLHARNDIEAKLSHSHSSTLIDSMNELPIPPSERKIKEKQLSISTTTTSSSQDDEAERKGVKDGSDGRARQKPPKPAKPSPKQTAVHQPDVADTMSSHPVGSGIAITSNASITNSNTSNSIATADSVPSTKPLELEFTVTSTERSLVTSGVDEAFYLDGCKKCLISSSTGFHASTERDCQDMFLSQFIPSPKSNVKSLSWHISITDNVSRSDGYQLSIYKVLLRRSKSWCSGNNWTLFIDGKHVATGKVPLFTMTSEIRFELPSAESSEGSAEKQTATIEIKRKAWYRRKLTYKFKIGGNEYPTYYAQPVDLYQSLPPTTLPTEPQSVEDASTSVVLTDSPQKTAMIGRTPTTDKPPVQTSTIVLKRGSAGSSVAKALSSTASTLKSSATASALPRSKSITRMFSPAQMIITIPSTNTEISPSGKQKIYFQILIRIPALPQPIVVERRYKHFSQLWNLLRGELALTMEESLLSSGGVDKENKTVSSACHAKLSQFPVLPPKVYNPMVDQNKPDFIKTRRLALQSFLIELMSYDPKIVHCSEFLGFLGLHPITCTSILKE